MENKMVNNEQGLAIGAQGLSRSIKILFDTALVNDVQGHHGRFVNIIRLPGSVSETRKIKAFIIASESPKVQACIIAPFCRILSQSAGNLRIVEVLFVGL